MPVAVHKLDADFLRTGQDPPLKPTGTLSRFLLSLMSRRGQSTAPQVAPDIIIEDDMSLKKFGVDGSIIHTPGHTQGSISIALSSGEVIVGDLIMKGLVRSWQPNYPLFADNTAQVKKSLQLVLQGKPTRILCSHGGPFDPAKVARRFHCQ